MTAIDLIVAVAAGIWIERRSRGLAATGFAATLVAVAAAVHQASPELARYRGSSGVSVGLVALAAADLVVWEPRPLTRLLALGALVLLGAKIAVEAATGSGLLPWTLPPGVVVAGKAHAAGAAAGLLVALAARSPAFRRAGASDGRAD